jgi:hypothetical protein
MSKLAVYTDETVRAGCHREAPEQVVRSLRPIAPATGLAVRARRRLGMVALAAAVCAAGLVLASVRVARATRLQLHRLPTPARAIQTDVSGVSCPSTIACLAVGHVLVGRGARPLAEGWNGRAWSILPRPDGLANGALNGVTCTSARSCIAVGMRNRGASSAIYANGEAAAEFWNGRQWSAERVALPARRTSSELDGVSCRSPADCVAVGFSSRPDRNFPLVEHWNGSRWSLRRAPMALDGILYSVSCPSRVMCVAVGGWAQGTLKARWNGHRWSTRLGDESGGDSLSALYGVACSSRGACIAVGGRQSIGGDDTIIDRWNGRRWSRLNAWPVGVVLYGVSCTSGRACTTVGEDGSVGRWDGRRWSRPRLHVNVQFSGVSCVSARMCVAVGTNGGDASWLTARTARSARIGSASARGMEGNLAIGKLVPRNRRLRKPKGRLVMKASPVRVQASAPSKYLLAGLF